MKRSLAVLSVFLLATGVSRAEILFGPEEYVRTEQSPQTHGGTFPGEVGRRGTLAIVNGSPAGDRRVTSAVIRINDEVLFAPDDFHRSRASLAVDFDLRESNSITIELRGEPGCYLTVEVSMSDFHEEIPAWRMPDLAVTDLGIEPDRADPGAPVTFVATVASVETAATGAAQLRFLVDEVEVCRRDIASLGPGVSIQVSCPWIADASGRHHVAAEVAAGDGAVDHDFFNNRRTATVRVSGEADPEPELELRAGFDPLQIEAGQPFTFVVEARNPSFALLEQVSLSFLVDGELLDSASVENLAPGEMRTLEFTWPEAQVGRHTVVFRPEQPDAPVQMVYLPMLSVDCVILYQPKQLYDTMQKGRWVSIGPGRIEGGPDLPGGSVGRIDSIAIDPQNPQTLYVASPTGGLWRTDNGGNEWQPLTDGLPTLYRGAVAVDPVHSSIVYYGTGHYGGGENKGLGIFKSLDRGEHWSQFAVWFHPTPSSAARIGVVEDLEIRYRPSGEVLIYAATNQGVLRYLGSDPFELRSTSTEWKRIKTGEILEIGVNPADSSEILASGWNTGLWRTTIGETAQGDADWQEIFPRPGNTGYIRFDVHWTSPKTIWAALAHPGGVWSGHKVVMFKSQNDGAKWHVPYAFDMDGVLQGFVRVRPGDEDEIFFGGVDLYWCQGNCGEDAWTIRGVHADQKDLQWDPSAPDAFYVSNDGGIFRCEWSDQLPFGGDYLCAPRNSNLRVTQFYDFDASPTDPDLMIGGTQDNGTIMFTGDRYAWDEIKGGDGYHALIAPTSPGQIGGPLFYAQHQHLDSTKRCPYGKTCDPGSDWKKASSGLPTDEKWGFSLAQIEKDPLFDNIVYSMGPQVYMTGSHGDGWSPIGPTAADGSNGNIVRVGVHPQRRLVFAGNDKGQIFVLGLDSQWRKIFEPWSIVGAAGVRSLAFSPVDPDILYVIFNTTRTDKVKAALSLYRLEFDPDTFGASALPVTGDFPIDSRKPLVIAGDGHDGDVVYVGTDQGVYRGKPTCTTCVTWSWESYSDGLPLVKINDLLVDPTSKELRAASYGRGAWSVITGP